MCFGCMTMNVLMCDMVVVAKVLRLGKYSHTCEYSLANIRIPANIRYILLRIVYESLSQISVLISIRFFLKIFD
jgi:hypothetical protein